MRMGAFASEIMRLRPGLSDQVADVERSDAAGRLRLLPVVRSPADDAVTVELPAVFAAEGAVESDRSMAVGRLRLLGAVLGDLGLSGFVRGVCGDGLISWPVLFITDPWAPWAVSVGPVSFWLGDPVRWVAPSQRVLEAAWVVAELLGRRP